MRTTHRLPRNDYDPLLRNDDLVVLLIVFGLFLVGGWGISLADAGNSMVTVW